MPASKIRRYRAPPSREPHSGRRLTLDVAGPLDVFAEANGFLQDDQGYDLVLLASKRGPIRASNGMP